MFYHDTQTERGKDTYREFTQIGEEPWSKPEKFDIVLTLDGLELSTNERIEILIKEKQRPTSLNQSVESLRDERWIPNKIIFSETGKSIKQKQYIKNGKLLIRDVFYLSIGYKDSMLYEKTGFRLVAVYYNEATNEFERIEKEILLPE